MKIKTRKTTKAESPKKENFKAMKGRVLKALVSAPARATTDSLAGESVAVPAPALDAAKAPAAPRPARIILELVRPGATHVCVAGSFNGWKPDTTKLEPTGNGRWTGSVEAGTGRHEYLFVVDGSWIPDPNARESVSNPFGGVNSVLTV